MASPELGWILWGLWLEPRRANGKETRPPLSCPLSAHSLPTFSDSIPAFCSHVLPTTRHARKEGRLAYEGFLAIGSPQLYHFTLFPPSNSSTRLPDYLTSVTASPPAAPPSSLRVKGTKNGLCKLPLRPAILSLDDSV